MIIEKENEKDYQAIYNLIKESFATAEHSDGNEQDLVTGLRDDVDFLPELALTAKEGNKLLGYILFSKARIAQEEVLLLAPLAVLPSAQKQGIGSMLITEGHIIAKKLGYDFILVLGSNLYYPKFGYLPAESFGISIPEGFPSQFFMCHSLNGKSKIIGNVTFAKPFKLIKERR